MQVTLTSISSLNGITTTLETKVNWHHLRVSIRESFGIIGDGLPVIDVDLRPGREPERKKRLVDGISSVLKDTLNIDPEDVYCIFRETPAHNHYTGGEPLPDWVPADK